MMPEYPAEIILDFFYHNPFYGLLIREAKRNSLSLEQYHLLHSMYSLDQVNGSVLADNLGVSKAAISRRCWELQEQGLITEVRSLSDRRQRILQLTPKGKKLLGYISERYNNLIKKIAVQMGEERWSKFNQELINFKKVSELINQRDLADHT